jgi:N-methylhydantoinase B
MMFNPGSLVPTASSVPTTEIRRIDPILLSLLQHRLDAIAVEMGTAMQRTALSPIFSIAHDFSCFITDAQGYTISQADGLPIHTGGGGFAVRRLLRYWADDIYPGDLFIANDPYFSVCGHLPDWTVMYPVFVDGLIVAFTCNRAHMVDIGGGAPGSYDVHATEIFQEGVRLPPLKLKERGETRRDIFDLLALNSRAPTAIRGDLAAMIGSVEKGGEQVASIFAEYGREIVEAHTIALFDYAEQMMKQEITHFEPGTYVGEELMNNDVTTDRPVRIRVTLTVTRDTMVFDFSGTDLQIRGFKNSPIANTHSAVYTAISMMVDPLIPHNDGAYRPIRIQAPPGTVVNASEPAAVTYSTASPAHDIIHACLKALNIAAPDRAFAGWGKVSHPIMSGRRNDGEIYVMYHWGGSPGAGAVLGRDGFDQLGALTGLGGLVIPNLEEYEQAYPVRFIRQSFNTDAGGPGKYRGGTGVEYLVQVEERATWIFRAEGVRTPSGFGAHGGFPGRESKLLITGSDLAADEFEPPQYGMMELPPCTLAMTSAGGGGWGIPFHRAVKSVADDVRDELVSRDRAAKDYGVVVGSDLTIDEQATEELRRKTSEGERG